MLSQIQAEYQSHIARFGMAATYRKYSGTVCPCMASGLDGIVQYNPEWHLDNPTAEKCNGTGKIARSYTDIPVLTMVTDESETIIQYVNERVRTEIGEMDKLPTILFQPIKVSDLSLIDLTGIDVKNDLIIFSGVTYSFYHVTKNLAIMFKKE